MKTEHEKTFSAYRNFLNKKDPVFSTLEDIEALIFNIEKENEFPLILDLKEAECLNCVDTAETLKEKIQEVINQWANVYGKNPLIKHMTGIIEGRFSEVGLKRHYISEKKLDVKYSDIKEADLLNVLKFPDFTEIEESIIELQRQWTITNMEWEGILTVESVFNNSNPVILEEWVSKMANKKAVKIKSPEDKEEVLRVLKFLYSFLDIIQLQEGDKHRYSAFMEFLSSREFIKLPQQRVNISSFQKEVGLNSFLIRPSKGSVTMLKDS